MERIINHLSRGWKFKLYPDGSCPETVFSPDFDDSEWESVRVPHDWAASGTFEHENDASFREILQDGIKSPIIHSGRTGALPIVGLGVYRIWLDIPESARGKSITLEFDGVMWDSNVYVGGKQVFFNHFGYKSFEIDISEYTSYGAPTLVTVAAQVYHDCSRWYPGAGIYRNVYLVEKNIEHINYNGIWLRQVEVTDEKGVFELSVDYTGCEELSFRADIISPDGEKVCEVSHGTFLGELSDLFEIKNVQLWDIKSPRLYTAEITLLSPDGDALDNVSVRFGARNFRFDADDGFFLNNRRVRINGVCMHHDLGSLGAAVNVAAMRRQLRILREMGVNAIRTSHNPPAPELLELCDELGFLVMDEFFDEWYTPKVSNGYAKYFREHAEEDAISIIKRDRNHPCVILWSIGNEMLEQWNSEGWRVTKFLNDICHRTDPTRPTTAGFSWPDGAFGYHMVNFVDVVGLNYKPHLYKELHAAHPGMKFYGSETASCISTRGVYHLPAEIAIPCIKRDDLTISAYELEAPEWAYYSEREFAAQDDCEFMAGEFIWTGFDYLGEPTPYYTEWPSRSAYFGAIDMAGLPKNRFYAYKARWTNDEVLHIFPHWNWEGHEGDIVPVHVYTSYPEVELFINGKSQGKRHFGDFSGGALGEVERYRLMWNETKYEAGELKAVAYDSDGNIVAERTVRTASVPHHIELEADRTDIAADGEDIVCITASIMDEFGTLCPHSNERIFFSVEGGELLTTDNGDQREVESFARADKKCLSGWCVTYVRSLDGVCGRLRVIVRSENLPESLIEIAVLK